MIDEKWPSSNPEFYRLGTNKKNIITIKGNSNLQEEFMNYGLMFKKAAHLLTEYVLEKPDISKLDSYFFSLAYLYRHSLELLLKAIGFKYISRLEDRKKFIKDTFHNLLSLLEYISPYLESLIKNDQSTYNWIETFFQSINEIDKESDSFRYPFGITVKKEDSYFGTSKQYCIKTFFNKQTHIDLVDFANKMETSFDILESYYSSVFIPRDHYQEYNPVFLEEGGNYYGQSVLGYSYSRNKFYPYVRAYTDSADYFYEKIYNNEDLKDTLFIPMCYLYRNGIELGMKEILFEECSYDFQNATKILKNKKHSIFGLWDSIKDDIIRHSNASENDNTLFNVEEYVKQLHQIDGTSDKFRYPVNKHLDLHFKRVKKVDIQNVAKFFGDFSSFLNAVCALMSAQNELLAEMQTEYRAEIQAEYLNEYS